MSVSSLELMVVQSLLPAAEEFLKKYIHVWDGKLHRDVILDLLSFAPLTRFDRKDTSEALPSVQN